MPISPTNQILVIVESPTKSRTISRFLPSNYKIVSSMGHIRDLPANSQQIPKKYRDKSWANYGINIDDGFKPIYIIPPQKAKIVSNLKQEIQQSDTLILATDEDREGEAISWHIYEILKPKIPVKRMVFHEITKKAIQNALIQCRDIDMNKVSAQETRRILDRLVGYTLSPILWKKIGGKIRLSAGRVQSVAVRIIVEKERQRLKFIPAIYTHIEASVSDPNKQQYKATMVQLNGKKIAKSSDFDDESGKLKKNKDVLIIGQKEAESLTEILEKSSWNVQSISTHQQKNNPPAPFITSTLQQEASRKLGWGVRNVMIVAQKLYEKGFITYMRTDSTTLSKDAITMIRQIITNLYGKNSLSKHPLQYKPKSTTAQEAHEAIRPSGNPFPHPDEVQIEDQEVALYRLIWQRSLACQMKPAVYTLWEAQIETIHNNTTTLFISNKRLLKEAGFQQVYLDPTKDHRLPIPSLKLKEKLTLEELTNTQKKTTPPPQYTEASLVRKLEALEIGRPSTYATIVQTIQERNYVQKKKNYIVPTFSAFATIQLLEKHFPNLIDYAFTSQMETVLDQIAENHQHNKNYLTDFFLGSNGLQEYAQEKMTTIEPSETKKINFTIKNKSDAQFFVGLYGSYFKSPTINQGNPISIPENIHPGDITQELLETLINNKTESPEIIGIHPETNQSIYIKNGPYGPYIEISPPNNIQIKNSKPKRISIPSSINPSELTLEQALFYISLPKKIGTHPQTNQDIAIGIGRYGPYLSHNQKFVSIPKNINLQEINQEKAITIIESNKTGLLRTIGNHPETNLPIETHRGRYGIYLKYNNKNFRIPKTLDETLTIDEAINTIGTGNSKKQKKLK